MVVDSIEELKKIKDLDLDTLPNILIRIRTDDSSSGTPLSSKFGASIEESFDVIEEIQSVVELFEYKAQIESTKLSFVHEEEELEVISNKKRLHCVM